MFTVKAGDLGPPPTLYFKYLFVNPSRGNNLKRDSSVTWQTTSHGSALRRTDLAGTELSLCYLLLNLWAITLQRMKKEIQVFGTHIEKLSSAFPLPL